MSTIHRINPEIWCLTPAGEAEAMFLIDYGPSINTIWVCRIIATGNILHVDSGEIRIMGNPMWNIPNPKPFTGREINPNA